MSDDRNLSLRHRHGQAWTHSEFEVPASERSPVAMRWVVVALVAIWVGVILLVRGCA